jgi:Mg-chelatase subunit ChlD
MSDLTKPPSDTSFALSKGKLSSKASGFKARLAASQSQANAVDPQTMPNRICLMLDCSGSMDNYEQNYNADGITSLGKRRIDLLKDAVQNFVSRCSFHDTSVAIATFPGHSDKALPLTNNSSQIIGYSVGLEPAGGTPLHDCVTRCLTDVPMTRGVIVSDGGATDWLGQAEYDGSVSSVDDKDATLARSILQLYKDQHISIDCVHIASSQDGEDLLRKIASTTGGIFIKFSDVSAFSKAFGYLAPSYRAMLTSGIVSASELGAKEIK